MNKYIFYLIIYSFYLVCRNPIKNTYPNHKTVPKDTLCNTQKYY